MTIIHESLLSNLKLIHVPGQCFWSLIKGNAHAAMIILVYHNFSTTTQRNHKVLETRNFKSLTSHKFCLPTLCELVKFTIFCLVFISNVPNDKASIALEKLIIKYYCQRPLWYSNQIFFYFYLFHPVIFSYDPEHSQTLYSCLSDFYMLDAQPSHSLSSLFPKDFLSHTFLLSSKHQFLQFL